MWSSQNEASCPARLAKSTAFWECCESHGTHLAQLAQIEAYPKAGKVDMQKQCWFGEFEKMRPENLAWISSIVLVVLSLPTNADDGISQAPSKKKTFDFLSWLQHHTEWICTFAEAHPTKSSSCIQNKTSRHRMITVSKRLKYKNLFNVAWCSYLKENVR